MHAAGMIRGQEGVHHFEIPMPSLQHDDEVLIKVKSVGLDGTDFGIVNRGVPDIADGADSLVLGHEMVGIVQQIGRAVTTVSPGDAVALTVRRGCGICHPCLHNQSDMCMTGLFTERGIHKLDGFLTEYVVDREQYMVRIPPELVDLAVFTEPLSIVGKAIDQIRLIQSRLPWTCTHPEHSFESADWGGCKTALVVGAGPLGLLAAALIRLSTARTYVADIVPAESPKAQLVQKLGAHYIDARKKKPQDVVASCSASASGPNIILEASGAAETALRLIPHMSRSSIYVMTGIPRGEASMEIDAAELVRQIVRYNQVVVGSVNSNRTHFEKALGDIGEVNSRFGGLLDEMITHRFSLDECHKAFSLTDPRHIKTMVNVAR
jgi:glucose 1-dehydrogenase